MMRDGLGWQQVGGAAEAAASGGTPGRVLGQLEGRSGLSLATIDPKAAELAVNIKGVTLTVAVAKSAFIGLV